MTVKTGSAWAGTFVTQDATGALATPSVGPAGVLYVDGVANGAGVTITGANPYKFAVTLPTLTAGQRVDMYITATISTIATAAFVASEQADTSLVSDVKAETALILEDTGTDIPALITALSAWQATNVNSGVTNGLITQIRGDSWDFDIDPVTLDSNKQQFCIKEKSTDLDSESILFMDNITGLLYLNGAAATASDATLTYTGTKLNIKLNAEASAQLPVGKFHYGAQYKTAAGIVKEPYGGIFTISSDLVLATE